MLISLFPTPFGHFQFLGSAGQNPKLILTLCHKKVTCGEQMLTILSNKVIFADRKIQSAKTFPKQNKQNKFAPIFQLNDAFQNGG